VLQRSSVGLHRKDGSPMFINERFGILLLVSLLCTSQISARQHNSPTQPGDGKIHLDVVVTAQSGLPVSGLQEQDFTVLDNEVPQTITSFEFVDGRKAPMEVILLIDAVNIGSRDVAAQLGGITSYLKADGGRLAHPTAVVFLTDQEIQFQEQFSQDGNALSAEVDQRTTSLRNIAQRTGSYAAAARFQLSLQGLRRLMAHEDGRPGRKIILWVFPGWPVLSGPQHMLDAEQEQQAFGDIVDISTELRESQITLYTVDPSGSSEIGPRASSLQQYLKGLSKPSQVRSGNFALEVIATQSGGLVLNSDNDVAAQLQQCLADTEAYYELSFDPATTGRPNEYRQLEVKIAKPGLTVRTRQGYYANSWRPGNIGVEFAEAGTARSDSPRHKSKTEDGARATNEGSWHAANAGTYIDAPVAELVERVPELKTLQPAPDQQELPLILQKMGQSEDDFARDVGDLIAHEYVTEEKLTGKGDIAAKRNFQDNYLILHHGNEWGANAEYRMDDKGHRLRPIGLESGYLVTSGYALSSIGFSTAVQSQSKFRYLGEEEMDSRETYVLAFVQKPGESTFLTTMSLNESAEMDVLTQGVLWVDKNSFQIIRMRTDLLAQRNGIRLDQLTTVVTFFGVHLQDVAKPLWLPSDVDVYLTIDNRKFRTVQHYTNYRRYRVSVKIGASQ
jgi:VWFA-related protein